jgi:hypothetical protein
MAEGNNRTGRMGSYEDGSSMYCTASGSGVRSVYVRPTADLRFDGFSSSCRPYGIGSSMSIAPASIPRLGAKQALLPRRTTDTMLKADLL